MLRRKHLKTTKEKTLDAVQRLVIKMPSQLIYEARSYAALQGERGPGPVIQRALTDYLKRNPIPSRSL